MSRLIFLFSTLILLCSHDLYLKLETYFLKPNQEVTLSLFNGTFEKSENSIARDRMADASVISNGKRVAINPNQWSDRDSTHTQMTLATKEAGTYMVGVSIKARKIEFTAEKFNSYLEHDGVSDMLVERKNNGLLGQDAIESYQKHVKAIYQVGDAKTDDWSTKLGYPIEFVPLSNPYDKFSGEELEVQLLLDGKPLSNQLVNADYVTNSQAHSHSRDDHEHDHNDKNHDHLAKKEETHTHSSGQQLRTNDDGIIKINLPVDGIYYLRTINMKAVNGSNEITHESKWATLTFEVSHKHDDSTHTHDDHHEDGYPTWIFLLSSLLIIGLLFLVFRKKD